MTRRAYPASCPRRHLGVATHVFRASAFPLLLAFGCLAACSSADEPSDGEAALTTSGGTSTPTGSAGPSPPTPGPASSGTGPIGSPVPVSTPPATGGVNPLPGVVNTTPMGQAGAGPGSPVITPTVSGPAGGVGGMLGIGGAGSVMGGTSSEGTAGAVTTGGNPGAPSAGQGGMNGVAGAAGMGGEVPGAMEWLPSWATSIQRTETGNLPPPLGDKTLRQYLWPTYSGEEIRIQLSNEKGTAPAVINKVHIASPGAMAGQIDPATDAAFLFAGSPSVTIPPGETVWSDPLTYPLREMQRTAVTMHFQSVPNEITGHPGSRNTSYIGSGDSVASASLSNAETRDRWYFIDAIEVMAPADAFAVAALGDSITDGYGVLNTFERWTDFLTIAVNEDPVIADKVSILNYGMGANSLLNGNGDQDSGLVRFERDVLGRSKVKWLILLHGVNDIGNQSDLGLVDQVTAAYQDIIDRSHAAGILVYGSPITPFKGNSYEGGQALTIRTGINDWVRNTGPFDAVVDLAAAVADPSDSDRLLPMFSNDGLHPSIAGYEAMGNAVDTSLFYEIMP